MRNLLTFLAFLLAPLFCNAQYFEAGTFVGASNYRGDVSNSKIDNKEYNTAIGIFARYNMTKHLALKASMTRGEISGNDQNFGTEKAQLRNLSFRSEIVEFAISGELNLMSYNIPAKEISTPYLFAGVSLFHFNPQAEYNGRWVDLQPLGTEGQYMDGNYPEAYNRWQMSIPMGLGFKFNLNHRTNFGLEFGARATFTDYLDDVSTYYPDIQALRQIDPLAAKLSYRTPEYTGSPMENPVGEMRGDASASDLYFFVGATLSVNLTDKYGLDFDEKYDVFKEDFENYLKEEKERSRRKKRLSKRAKRRKQRKAIKKKKRDWKETKKNDETLSNPNILHGTKQVDKKKQKEEKKQKDKQKEKE